jgi:hypothetical protein
MIQNKIGEKYLTGEGYWAEIIEDCGWKNCSIKLNDERGTIITGLRYSNVIKGSIKNPYNRSVYGIGYYGIGSHMSSTDYIRSKSNSVWVSMLQRCYSEKYHVKKPTYVGCVVCDEWHDYQVFAEWFDINYVDGYALDKDILIKGNKIYSPDTCCFVPTDINSLFIGSSNRRGDMPMGVKKYFNKFQSRITKNSINAHIGTFDTKEEAFYAYKKEKEAHIKDMAHKHKDGIKIDVFDAMINYVVDISD